MVYRYLRYALMLGPFYPAAATAQNLVNLPEQTQRCRGYVGQAIAPVDAEVLASRLGPQTSPRGEFETTVQYEARLKAASRDVPAALFVQVPLDKKYVTFDADAALYRIESYALDNRNASWDVLYDRANLPWARPVGSHQFVDLVVKFDEVVVGRYTATNAYGASTTVRKISRNTVGIIERAAAGSEDLFFPDRPYSSANSNVVAEIPVSAAEAPVWRSNLRAAALIEPKSPFVARGTKDWGPARFDKPMETSETLTAVIADIQCVVLANERNVVLAGIPTR